MFFLKKKKPIRNKLPEKLVALKHNIQPSWVWDSEYRIIVWSNAKGLKFWNVDTREEIKELIFPEDNSMVTICDKVEKKLNHDKIISEAIIFPTRPVAKKIICELSKQELPDGRFGILITALTSVDDNQTVDNSHKINNKRPLETIYLEHTHQQQEETMNTPVNTSDMIKTETSLDKTDIHNMMLLKPATLSCDHDLIIVGVNEVSQSVLNLNEGDDCYLLFSDADVADFVFDRILGNAKTSFIQKIDIGYGVLPYLLQATQFQSDGIAYFNMGILQISEEKYQDFLVNDPDNVITSIPPKSDSFSNESADNESSVPMSSHKNTLYDKRHLSSSLMGDMTGVGLFNVQKDGIIKAVNQMASNLMGLSETSLVGHSIIDLFGTDATHVLKELIVNQNNDVLHDLEQGVRCQYQDINHNEHIAKLVVRPNNAENGFWFILNDITELERIKNELSDIKNNASSILDTHTKINDSIKMATNTQIPQFVNSVSHEIRAPLNAIAGYAEMIESEVFGELNDARYKEFAQSIKSASIYALSIINELLDYSKLKAGGFMPQFEAVDVDKVVSEAIQTVYPLAVSRKIEIVKTILSGTPLINSDSRLLKQVLINVLTNAIKYSNDEKSVLLTAGLTKTGRVMFEITDFGRGMTKEQIHNALIPFNNAHKKEHNTASTGLGLSLSKELTELIHGRFMIDSVPNEKTRIRIIYEKTSLLNQP